jgi:hypothetical protein
MMLKLPQATWISTFVEGEGVTDKNSASTCETVSTVGLSRDGFTLKGGIGSIRS